MGGMRPLLIFVACMGVPAAARTPEYSAVQARLQHGWNSWDTNSVTEQVLLPEGLGIALGVRRRSSENSDAFLASALIGRKGADDEKVFPGAHSHDGSYSALRLSWRGVDLRLETANVEGDLVMLVTPLSAPGTAQPVEATAQEARTTFLRPDEKTSQPC